MKSGSHENFTLNLHKLIMLRSHKNYSTECIIYIIVLYQNDFSFPEIL